MKINTPYLIIIGALIIGGIFYFSINNNNSTGSYIDPQQRYTFEHSEILKPVRGRDGALAAPTTETDEQQWVEVTVDSRSILDLTDMTLEDYVEMQKETLEKDVEQTNIDLAGEKAIKLVFEGNPRRQYASESDYQAGNVARTIRQKIVRVYADHNGDLYKIEYSTPLDSYLDNVEHFEKIISTFNFLK